MIKYNYNGFQYKFNENYVSEQEVVSVTKIGSTEPPNELYHYFSLGNNSISSLLENYVYANHPYNFNDPYDCYPGLISFDKCSFNDIIDLNDGIFDIEKLKILFNSEKEEDKRKLVKHMDYLLFNVIYLKTGIFCLTDNIKSIEMWSYYSNHEGFSIKFDLNKFPKTYWGPFPVNYSKSFDKIDYRIFKKASFIYQANVKAKCWEPENEFRLIFYGPNSMKIPQIDNPRAHNRKFYYNPKAIKEIVLGYSFFSIKEYDFDESTDERAVITLKFKHQLKIRILNYIFKTNTPLSMVKIKHNGFNLKPHPVKLQKISNKKYILTFI